MTDYSRGAIHAALIAAAAILLIRRPTLAATRGD